MIHDVADPHDPRLAPYRHLRERDLVGRKGQFIIEGETTLLHALRFGRFEVQSVCVLACRAASLAAALGRWPEGLSVLRVSQEVIDQIAGFHMHRGVLALGIKREDLVPEPHDIPALLAATHRVLLLQGIANHDNMGGLFRSAAAFGVDLVLLDAACCDPLYRKAIRVSVGAALSVPFVTLRQPLAATLEDLRAAGFELWLTTPRGDVTPGERLRAGVPERLAIVMGAEGRGLPPEVLDRAAELGDHRVGVTMSHGAGLNLDSLNVVSAASIVLAFIEDAARSQAKSS